MTQSEMVLSYMREIPKNNTEGQQKMIWLYWAIKRHKEHRREIGNAMREMRRNGYTAEWHGMINKRRNWGNYAV